MDNVNEAQKLVDFPDETGQRRKSATKVFQLVKRRRLANLLDTNIDGTLIVSRQHRQWESSSLRYQGKASCGVLDRGSASLP